MGDGKVSNSRRKARIVALQALYEHDAIGHSWSSSLEHLLEENPLSQAGVAFARELVQGVLDKLLEIDGTIERFAPTWPVNQLSIIDRNVLRVAIYEIMWREETPPKVAIDEAVELAKLFGSDGSPKFINGVLGSVMRAAEGLKAPG